MKVTFSLSTLFWLILVVGLSLGWWMDRHQLSKQYQDDTAALTNMYKSKLGDLNNIWETTSNYIAVFKLKYKSFASTNKDILAIADDINFIIEGVSKACSTQEKILSSIDVR
jgi:hypothetical protein